jgi:hypothetical protein
MKEEKAEEWANDILKLVKCRCELRDEDGDWWYMHADIEKYLTNEQMPGGWEKQIKEELDEIRNENEEDSKEKNLLYICSKGCGDFTADKMKEAANPEDPTLVCPKCGSCEWYLAPIDEKKNSKGGK